MAQAVISKMETSANPWKSTGYPIEFDGFRKDAYMIFHVVSLPHTQTTSAYVQFVASWDEIS